MWLERYSMKPFKLTSFAYLYVFKAFFHVFVWLDSSFLFSAEYYSIVWMCHSLLIQSPTEGHCDCFQVLADMNKAATNIGRYLCGHNCSGQLGEHQ